MISGCLKMFNLCLDNLCLDCLHITEKLSLVSFTDCTLGYITIIFKSVRRLLHKLLPNKIFSTFPVQHQQAKYQLVMCIVWEAVRHPFITMNH